jgi:hypothetical protein
MSKKQRKNVMKLADITQIREPNPNPTKKQKRS